MHDRNERKIDLFSNVYILHARADCYFLPLGNCYFLPLGNCYFFLLGTAFLLFLQNPAGQLYRRRLRLHAIAIKSELYKTVQFTNHFTAIWHMHSVFFSTLDVRRKPGYTICIAFFRSTSSKKTKKDESI